MKQLANKKALSLPTSGIYKFWSVNEYEFDKCSAYFFNSFDGYVNYGYGKHVLFNTRLFANTKY